MFKPFDLSGKVALVTGGNGGIGLGMAEGLAQAGSNIAIWGTNADKNEKAKAQLEAHGVKVLTQSVDVADENAVKSGIETLFGTFGRIDTVIANAGIGGGASSFAEFPTDIYRKVLAVNLDGVFFTFREALKPMIDRAKDGDPGGSLVVTSSVSAVDGAPAQRGYASTKGGRYCHDESPCG